MRRWEIKKRWMGWKLYIKRRMDISVAKTFLDGGGRMRLDRNILSIRSVNEFNSLIEWLEPDEGNL